jgi:hypothetical protein
LQVVPEEPEGVLVTARGRLTVAPHAADARFRSVLATSR